MLDPMAQGKAHTILLLSLATELSVTSCQLHGNNSALQQEATKVAAYLHKCRRHVSLIYYPTNAAKLEHPVGTSAHTATQFAITCSRGLP